MENLAKKKNDIIKFIIETEDNQVLDEIENVLSNYNLHYKKDVVNDASAIYTSKIYFSEEQKRMLEEAEKDIENGNCYTDEEVRKMTEEWLK